MFFSVFGQLFSDMWHPRTHGMIQILERSSQYEMGLIAMEFLETGTTLHQAIKTFPQAQSTLLNMARTLQQQKQDDESLGNWINVCR